jgi:hypothetical protein
MNDPKVAEDCQPGFCNRLYVVNVETLGSIHDVTTQLADLTFGSGQERSSELLLLPVPRWGGALPPANLARWLVVGLCSAEGLPVDLCVGSAAEALRGVARFIVRITKLTDLHCLLPLGVGARGVDQPGCFERADGVPVVVRVG